MPKFRIKKMMVPLYDQWSGVVHQGINARGDLEYLATYRVQMRVFFCLWVTIREFAFDSEKQSEWCAKRLLREIQLF